jgi:hypothetical protein
MPALQAHAAYLLGFTPQILGIFFNGLLILDRARRGADGVLATRIDEHLETWVPSRGPEVVQNVHICEALLAQVGRSPGEPPQTIEAFYAWSENVNRETYQSAKASFDAAADPDEKTGLFRVRLAQDLGQQIGDVVHTMNLAGLVQALLSEGPGHAALSEQAVRFAQAQRQIVAALEKVLTYTVGYDDIQAEVQRVLGVLRQAPDCGATADHARVADALTEVPGALDVARVEKLFMDRD